MNHLKSYTNKMRSMNGTTDTNGMPSQGDQELTQKQNENEKTSMQQGNALKFLNTYTRDTFDNLFDRIIPETGVDYTGIVDTNNPDQYTVAQANIIPMLVKAVQELSAEVKMLKNK